MGMIFSSYAPPYFICAHIRKTSSESPRIFGRQINWSADNTWGIGYEISIQGGFCE